MSENVDTIETDAAIARALLAEEKIELYDYPGQSRLKRYLQAYLDLAALEPLCRELVTEIEAGRGGYVAFQKIRKVLNG